jgi:hypothetical protein
VSGEKLAVNDLHAIEEIFHNGKISEIPPWKWTFGE